MSNPYLCCIRDKIREEIHRAQTELWITKAALTLDLPRKCTAQWKKEKKETKAKLKHVKRALQEINTIIQHCTSVKYHVNEQKTFFAHPQLSKKLHHSVHTAGGIGTLPNISNRNNSTVSNTHSSTSCVLFPYYSSSTSFFSSVHLQFHQQPFHQHWPLLLSNSHSKSGTPFFFATVPPAVPLLLCCNSTGTAPPSLS
ncbi:hypothetical protein XENTR_v10000938 [Xenopus tropicalis]|nr:hypothetical protein XENTR_v10000938 [Xenopus tropicalis]